MSKGEGRRMVTERHPITDRLDGILLSDLPAFAEDLRKRYGGSACLEVTTEAEPYSDKEWGRVSVAFKREENAVEEAARKASEQQRDEWDRREYRRLREKFDQS